jgi:hypothetical protein
MTPTPTPEQENLPEVPNSKETPSNPDTTGFFNRVRQNLNKTEPKPEPPIHPTEAAEIVIMEDDHDR